MFIRYYVFVDQPFGQVERTLLSPTRSWLQEIARGVSDSSLALAELGVDVPGTRLRKTVEMRFGEPYRRDSTRTAVPFTWRATGVSGAFPTFEGDIEITHWRLEATQLAVSATYEPPFGPLGRMLDRAALHLLAEALVKDFLDRVAVAINPSPALK